MPTPFRITTSVPYDELINVLYWAKFDPTRSPFDSYIVRMIFTNWDGYSEFPDEYEYGSFYYPSGIGQSQFYVPTIEGSVAFGTDGTMRLDFYNIVGTAVSGAFSSYDTQDGETVKFKTVNNIKQYDKLDLEFRDATDHGNVSLSIYLPNLNNGTTKLYIDTQGRTYYDHQYSSLACGKLGILDYSDTESLSDSPAYKHEHWNYYDICTQQERFKINPLSLQVDYAPLYDIFVLNSIRENEITDWHFAPSYKVLFYLNDNANTILETNWDTRLNNIGMISKTSKHWTADYEVGNWTPEFADPDNVIFDTLFSSGSEPYGKSFELLAKISSRPFEWASQFKGDIFSAKWSNGKVNFDLKDKMKNLPNIKFIYDNKYIGTIIEGNQYGIVKKIIGTCVMFDDMGDMKYIPVTRSTDRNWMQIAVNTAVGVAGALTGGAAWLTAGMAGMSVVNELTKDTSEKTISAYWEVTDKNLIDDNIISSGNVIKFYQYPVDGYAQNLNSPLDKVTEKIVNGGTFQDGLHGTFYLNDTFGISVGDYIYTKQPIYFQGSPSNIIRQLLCGTNVDYPYSYSDFDSSFDSELSSLELMDLYNKIDVAESTTPFEKVKELCSEIGVTFYINELNQFAVKTSKPLGIFDSSGIGTYTDDTNIIDGFEYEYSANERVSGYRIFYSKSYIGNIGYNNGYTKKLEIALNNSSSFPYKEMSFNWIWNSDDAKTILWRQRSDDEKITSRIKLPTTLYGVMQSQGDLVRVSHHTGSLVNELFQIESYEKDFQSSQVTFDCIGVTKTYGYGNAIWDSSQVAIDTTSKSGISDFRNTNTVIPYITGTMGTLADFINAFSDHIWVQYPTLNIQHYYNSLAVIKRVGTVNDNTAEIVRIISPASPINGTTNYVAIERGVLNSVTNKWGTDACLYIMDNAKRDKWNNLLIPYNLCGTILNINPSIGTTFKFG